MDRATIDSHMFKYGLMNYDLLPYGRTKILSGLDEDNWKYAIERFKQEFPTPRDHWYFISFDVVHRCLLWSQFEIYLYKIDPAEIHGRLMKNFDPSLSIPQLISLKVKSLQFEEACYHRIAERLFIHHHVNISVAHGPSTTQVTFHLLPK